MSEHPRHKMGVNSLLAYWAGQDDLFQKRERLILEVLRSQPGSTDREVMLKLGFSDMNSVRPRLNLLRDDGVIEEVGSKVCPVTHKSVRMLRIKDDPRRPQFATQQEIVGILAEIGIG